MCESLDFHLFAPPSAHNWNSYFGQLGGTDSSDNNSLDFHEKIQNFCPNSCSEYVLSKTFRPRLKIPYHAKVIVKTVTDGNFSAHFLCDYDS